MVAKKETSKPDPTYKFVGIVKKGGLYYVATVTTQGDTVLDMKWNSEGDILVHAQHALKVEVGNLFWNQIHKEA